MLVFTNVALAPFCLCKDDSTLAKGPPKESGIEVMVPGAVAQPWLGAVTPMPVDTDVFTWSTCPFPEVLTWPPVGLGPPQLEVGTGFGPGPPVLSGSVDLVSLLSSSLESDFFPEFDLAAAAAAAAARSCLRNLARRFWNQTWKMNKGASRNVKPLWIEDLCKMKEPKWLFSTDGVNYFLNNLLINAF